MAPRRPIRVNFKRIDTLKQKFDYSFLTSYMDCYDLSDCLQDMNEIIPEAPYFKKTEDIPERLKQPLREYVIVKGTAIVENGFSNLVTFLVDTIGIDIYKSHKISSLEINIDDIDKLSEKKITKGLLVSDILHFGKPFLINFEISRFLRLDFHDTLSKLYTLISDEDFENDPELMGAYTHLEELSNITDPKSSMGTHFEEMFEKRNEIAHNATVAPIDENDVLFWLPLIALYMEYGTAFVLFYGIFCTDFKDYNSLSKLDYFRRDTDDNPIKIEEIKEVFEYMFGISSEKLVDFIKQQQKEFRNKV